MNPSAEPMKKFRNSGALLLLNGLIVILDASGASAWTLDGEVMDQAGAPI
ncbi:MAG TPA: hypothetical protein VJX23_16840 [Candidatus Binataceae bacterium]|nr:hypothetical protein [Candidatus Binataceae bacterium]